MEKKRKISFAVKFTLVVLLLILLIAGTISGVLIYNVYLVTFNLKVISLDESITRLRDSIVGSLERYVDMLENAGYGAALAVAFVGM